MTGAGDGPVDAIRALASAGRLKGASDRLATWLRSNPDDASALHLDIDLRLALGDATGAEAVASRLVQIAPALAVGHAGLGQARLAQGKVQAAIDSLQVALDRDPRHAVSAMLLNGALQLTDRHAEAAAVTEPFIHDALALPELLTNHAGALLALSRREEALELARRAVAAAPQNSLSIRTLASALMDMGRGREAQEELRSAQARGVDGPKLRLALAATLLAQDLLDDAEREYLAILARAPRMLEAQRALANLRWSRTGDLGFAEATLSQALAQYPGDEELHVARAELRFFADDLAGADAVLAGIADRCGPGLRLTASNMALRVNPGEAARHAEAVVELSPDAPAALVALTEARLAEGKAPQAAEAADRLCALVPDDQHAVALRATAWRLLGDGRERRLLDYGALVGTFMLEPPKGWTDLSAFLNDLSLALERLHVTQAHPVGQSVRGGSQTTRSLLHSNDPAIRGLFQVLDAPIRRYIDSLGEGDDPMRRRRRGSYAYAGAWSVRLRGGVGRHTNHVHPRGWISSACYVSIPATLGRDSGEGWLHFGAPGTPTNPPLEGEFSVRPEPGKLVLFPSYMWHGVTPFSGEGVRMTVAFDLVPA